MDILTLTPSHWIENEEKLSQMLDNECIRNTIPLLNVTKLEHLGNTKLVRFHGMIQDMHTPEYYLEQFEVINTATNTRSWEKRKFMENIRVNDDEYINCESTANVTSERQTFVVISVPGLNNWIRLVEYKVPICKILPENANKRLYEDVVSQENSGPSQSLECKKVCNDSTKLTSCDSKPIPKYPDIFPLPNASPVVDQGFHIKLYKHQEKLKINDVCEFVGFLDMDPSSSTNNDDDMDTDATAYFFPKIHCIYFTKLNHNNLLLSNNLNTNNEENFCTVRKDLLLVLTQLLLGDTLAAEYLLLHLISEVYSRTADLALGKFSLNISNIPNIPSLHYPCELYKFIEKLMPKSFYLPMTLENLNSLTFVPKKDYDRDYLASGLLQLSNNTHLVLDEFKLTPGRLDEVGLNNIKAISTAIKHQSVTYDFKFYPLEFKCDIPFLILSEGKSILPSDVHVVLQPDPMCVNTFKEIIEAVDHFLKPEVLNNIRRYLTLTRKSKYTITEQIEEFIQNDFVRMRQNVQGDMTADDLHSVLILARLVSISEGKTSLDEQSWNRALQMKEQSKSRVKK